jgi:indolepyruvate ferredoxin oxidoreductase, alpha subunit
MQEHAMESPADRLQRRFLSGNEAVALGALDAGVAVAAAYPGTPSTEIIETLASLPGVHAEWSVNEKVAFEVALGASLMGRRSLTAMKHVGLNVAADTLMSAGLSGVGAGMVIAVADDVGFSSSQNEQDSRYWARFAHLPVLEPADAQQAYEMARAAFELSERHQMPVLLRLTTRVCHVKRAVVLQPARPAPAPVAYAKDPLRWVLTPNHVAARIEVRAQRQDSLRAEAEQSPWNVIAPGSDWRVGVIASGPACHAVREALPDAPLLALGFSAPLPVALVERFAATVDHLLVVEESEPLVETELRAAGLDVHGRELLPAYGEITAAHVAHAAAQLLLGDPEPARAGTAQPVFTRPPTLCAGCGYLGVYYWLARLPDTVVCGDIGCYTLGASPPWNSVDSALAMGASLGMASGAAKAQEGAAQRRPVVAVIGDSTFLHSGMPGLLNLTYQRANVTVLLLDNRATAMTGGQNNPANGHDLHGGPASVRVDFAKLVEALGVRPERIRSADPYELPTFAKVLREEMKAGEPSVIITTRPCVFTPEFQREPALVVDDDQCNGCTTCLDVGCPAVLVTRREQQVRASGKVVELAWVRIDPQLCTGCAICAKACSRGAIARPAARRVIALEPA